MQTKKLILAIGLVASVTFAWVVCTDKINDFGKRRLPAINKNLEFTGNSIMAQGSQALTPPIDESKETVEMVERLGGTALIATTGHVIAINLTGCQVRDDDLIHLAHTPELVLLNLDNTPISDDGLKFVRGLSKLKTLRLCRTKVTDVGLGNLGDLKKLTTLHIDDTPVTDYGIEHLIRFPTLTAVFAMGSSVTFQAQKTLPHCRIKF